MTPRGIRNNNPGNIEKGTDWEGLATNQPDGRYAAFVSPEYGIRAMARTLRTYREKHGKRTINDIINRWAPPFENPTDDYVKFISDRMNVSAYVELTFDDNQVAELLAAIIHFENGQQPYDRETILRGIELERA